MADEIQSNIKVNIDTSAALASIKQLQTQISAFHTQMSKGGAQAAAEARNLQQNLINSINATNKFAASMTTVKSSAEQFTDSLEKNKLSLGEYFRYAGASSRSFGRFFKTEFETINKVARERVKDLQTQYIKLGRDANGAMRAIKVRPLILDMENLSTKTQIAAQRQQLLNQLLKQGSTNLLNFGKNTQWAGRQLMVGFTVPLTMAGTAAAKSFMEMEKAAIKFKRVYGDMFTTTEETNKVFNDIKKIAMEFTKFGLTVQDTMDMAATAAATGATGAKLLAQVTQANKLATLGAIDQQQALQTTISLVDAFGISAEDLTKKIDFLNAVENQTITSIEDLTIAIPKAAPVVRQLGGDVEDLTFFLTAMKEGGVNASEGANALKSGLASLINPTAKTSAMMKQMGIDINAIVEKDQGNLKQTVLNFASALDTLDPLNRARAIEQMFGKFQFSRLSTLFKNVADENSQANRVMELAARTPQQLAYISQKEMEKMQESTMYKFQESIAKLQAAMAPIGEQFMKVVTPIIDGITKILNAFNNLPDSVKNFAMILVAGVGGLGPVLLMTFGLIANGVANLIKLFANLKDFFNRTGKSSLDLGSQTKYMTTKQIEAAAVGASLEQVHSKLQQRFTVEAKAVDQLTAAYGRSIAAQRAFMGPIVSSDGTKRKGFAKGGIVRGPGTGTSDSIPAMLSNGEAVIPAKQTAKYSGLIQNMIMDNLPRFAAGGVVNTAMANARSLFQLFGGKAAANRTPTLAFKMRGDALGQFIQEGQYKSLFHGVRSSAQDTQSQRALIEKATMGVPVGSGAAQRPVYGFLTSKEMVPTYYGTLYQGGTPTQLKKDSFGTHDPLTPEQRIEEQFLRLINPQSVALRKYGENTLFLKPEALARASISFGDTLTIWEQALKLGKKVPLVRKLFQTNKSSLAKTLKASKSIYKDSKMGAIPYIEAHLPGGFSIQDVERIGISNDFPERTAAKIVEVQKLLKENGLENISVFDLGTSSRELGKMFTSKHNYLANGGIVSGPGSGTSDSILAMVSNGEAIIPAKQAQKYSGIVKGMIADNLPGFQKGKLPGAFRTYTDFTALLSREANTALNTGSAIPSNIAGEFSANPAAVQGPLLSLLAEKLFGATKPADIEKVLRNNPNLIKYATSLSNNIAKEVSQITSSTMSDADLVPAVQRAVANTPAAANIKSAVENIMISPTTFEEDTRLRQRSSGRIMAMGRERISKLRGRYSTVGARGKAIVRRMFPESTLNLDDIRYAHLTAPGMMTPDQIESQIGAENLSRQMTSALERKRRGVAVLPGGQEVPSSQALNNARKAGKKKAEILENAVVAGMNETGEMRSPSRKTKMKGQQLAQGAIDGIAAEAKQARQVGAQIGAAATQGMRNGIAASSGTKYIPGMFATDFDGQGGILQGPRQGTRLERFKSRFNYALNSGVGRASTALQKVDRSKVMGLGFGLSSAAGMASMMPGSIGQIAGQVAGPVMLLSTLTSMFPDLVAGFGRLLPILTRLSPILLGITAVVGTSIFLYNQSVEARKKEYRAIHDLGNAAILTNKKIKTLADFFGIVPNEKSPLERAKITPGLTKNAMQMQSTAALLEDKAFKQDYNSAIKSLKEATREEAINLMTSLSVGFRGKGFSDESIQTIMNALRQSSRRSDIKFDINKLTNKSIQQNISSQISQMDKSTSSMPPGFEWAESYMPRNAKDDKAFYTAGANLSTMLKGFSSQFAAGTLNIKDFNAQFDNLQTSLSEVNKSKAIRYLDIAVQNLDKSLRRSVQSMDNVNDKLLTIKAASVGIEITKEQINILKAGSRLGASFTALRAADLTRKQIKEDIAEYQKIQEEFQKEYGKTPEGIAQRKQERLSAAMTLLNKQEDAINKKYDARLKKLDEIQKANDKIAQQQKGQLDLADALSRGDISAAAGIVTGIRAQNAQSALEEQRAGINAAREAELASATITVGGKKYKKQDLQEMLNALEYADLTKALGSGSFAGYAKRGFAKGGLVSYFAFGGAARGTDIVPAMLTPGEFVIKKSAVDRIGAAKLGSINNGASIGDSVYNYSINVNVRSDSNPDTIAQAVLTQIRRIDNMRVRGNTI